MFNPFLKLTTVIKGAPLLPYSENLSQGSTVLQVTLALAAGGGGGGRREFRCVGAEDLAVLYKQSLVMNRFCFNGSK